MGTSTHVLNPVKSARIRTYNSFYFTYGVVEIRAKMPVGDWLWPAFWLLPRYNYYGTWPTSGEIDILEMRGNENLVQNGLNIGVKQTGSTLHWGPSPLADRSFLTHWTLNNNVGYNNDFHTFGMEWTPTKISFFVDAEEIGQVEPKNGFWSLGNFSESNYSNPWTTTKMAPFDQQFYLILNLAIGGISFFPDNAENGNGNKVWKNNSTSALTDFWKGRDNWLPSWNEQNSSFLIDYIKVYAL